MTSATQGFQEYLCLHSRRPALHLCILYCPSALQTQCACLPLTARRTPLRSFCVNLRSTIRSRHYAQIALHICNLKAAFRGTVTFMNELTKSQSKWPASWPRMEIGTSKTTNPQRYTKLLGGFSWNIQVLLWTIFETVFTNRNGMQDNGSTRKCNTLQCKIEMALTLKSLN